MCGIFATINETISPFIIDNFYKSQMLGPEFSTIKQYEQIILGFHRLAINGLDEISNQPFDIFNCILICNGEIYNYKEIAKSLNIEMKTNSDCEIIIHLYKKFGIKYTLNILDGVFAFILYDKNENLLYIARDPFGVRPLYYGTNRSILGKNRYYFSSELKSIYNLIIDKTTITNFTPAQFMVYNINNGKTENYNFYSFTSQNRLYSLIKRVDINDVDVVNENLLYDTVKYISYAVKKRVKCDRQIACLLSGGLDSSIIAGLVNRYYNTHQSYNKKHILETYSIGMVNSPDLINARLVADHLKTNHTEIVLTQEEFFNAIPEVIEKIESFDTTTVRASVGNYLIAKYIKNNSNAKVIFNGDGADELMGGYIYMSEAPNEYEFDRETHRLLNDMYMYDVLRSDKSISSNGLEPRTPFLDRKWTDFYLGIDRKLRYETTKTKCEKYIIRKAFSEQDPTLLPQEIIWRKKEAFSDGVSSNELSWSDIIKSNIQKLYDNNEQIRDSLNNILIEYAKSQEKNCPQTLEQAYYRSIYNHYYKFTDHLTPYFWMPKYIDATDASARTLSIYNRNNIDE